MFDGWIKPKFYTKCKSALKHMRTRLEPIKKRREAVEKFLKMDIAELLKGSLDYNAYLRADMLLVEKNMTGCYDLVEQFCGCISTHLSEMLKEKECPEECREAVASLSYAAARFADLPELRQLRSIFTERYGNSLESYTNKEFVEKLKANPPTKDMKLQLMQNIAQEFSIDWDSKALEQKLFTPPKPQQDQPKQSSLDNSHDHDIWHINKDSFPKRDMQGSRKNEVTAEPRRGQTGQDSTTAGSPVSEDDSENNKPFYYRFVRPPYIKPKPTNTESNHDQEPTKPSTEAVTDAEEKNPSDEPKPKQKPRSVRKKRSLCCHDTVGATAGSSTDDDVKEAVGDNNNKQIKDEEEKAMDGLLQHYSAKKSPYEEDKVKAAVEESGESWRRKHRPAKSVSEAESSDSKAKKTHARASSLDLGGHVHPKLPDYDDLAARVAALRGI